MIPCVIHCCWLGKKAPGALLRKCRASWARFAPEFEVREWNEETANAFGDLPGYGFFEAAVTAGRWAMASDWLRMAALWTDGGVYFDCDLELTVGIVDLCAAGEWIASERTAADGAWLNPGSGIALEKGSPIARCMLEAYGRAGFDAKREMMPWINARLREALAAAPAIRVLSPEVFSPIGPDGVCRRTAETHGIHHYAMSGASSQRRVSRWLSWHGMRGIVDAALRFRHDVCRMKESL